MGFIRISIFDIRHSTAGVLSELCGARASAALSAALALVRDAQARGEAAAWVTARDSSFFPPDAAAAGVDLDALAVVRMARAEDVARAADPLVRSGAFGLVALDLGERPHFPVPLQARLAGLARRHGTAVLCLTRRRPDAPSLGPLFTLRAEAVRLPDPGGNDAYALRIFRDRRKGRGGPENDKG